MKDIIFRFMRMTYEGDVETSTAQSISVIFAFITGIIKMARENRNAADDDAKLFVV